jgi:hypothetical protein
MESVQEEVISGLEGMIRPFTEHANDFFGSFGILSGVMQNLQSSQVCQNEIVQSEKVFLTALSHWNNCFHELNEFLFAIHQQWILFLSQQHGSFSYPDNNNSFNSLFELFCLNMDIWVEMMKIPPIVTASAATGQFHEKFQIFLEYSLQPTSFYGIQCSFSGSFQKERLEEMNEFRYFSLNTFLCTPLLFSFTEILFATFFVISSIPLY